WEYQLTSNSMNSAWTRVAECPVPAVHIQSPGRRLYVSKCNEFLIVPPHEHRHGATHYQPRGSTRSRKTKRSMGSTMGRSPALAPCRRIAASLVSNSWVCSLARTESPPADTLST